MANFILRSIIVYLWELISSETVQMCLNQILDLTPSTFTGIYEVLSAAQAKYLRNLACGVTDIKTVSGNEEKRIMKM